MHEDRAFCKHCRYELSGLGSSICPECGKPFDPARRRSFTRHPRLRTWHRRIAAAVLGAFAAYVASYYCLVQVGQPTVTRSRIVIEIDHGSSRAASVPAHFSVRLDSRPVYRMGGRFATVTYRPIHAIDRKLRADTWCQVQTFDATPREPVLFSGPPRQGRR